VNLQLESINNPVKGIAVVAAGAPLDLKMQFENGRADERVSRGQASERAVCVCEAVSVEMGAHRPPLPTAVVCPPGRRHLRLAITADLLTGSGSRGQVAIFEFFDPGRIVAFLIENAEISCQSIFATFPSRTFHALLPLCTSMESPCPTPSASKNYIIRKSVTSSHHPAIFRCRGRGSGQFHTSSKRPATPRGNA
jgi:hypothetical protein